MQLIIEFLPIVLFFLTYKLWGIYAATIVAIISSGLAVLYNRWRKGRYEVVPLLTFISITLLGLLTLLLKDERFIKWKPTIIYWLTASGFLISQYVFKLIPTKKLLGKELALPDAVWRHLTWVWALFFLSLGAINLYILYNFSTEIWVNFKLFGTLISFFIFIFLQGIYLFYKQAK